MAESPVRKIIHIDMDAFFASVEQRDDPALRGRPVAVGFGAARGVVAAASYEARAFGVKSALPSVTAIRRCPELVFVPPRFDVYKAVSAQIHAIFAEYTDLIQPLSLDEAYLDVTDDLRGLGSAWATARHIRARILAETGLTASAGISYNKFLAKLACNQRKPDGQFAVTPAMGADWVETLPVARFHGVGPVTARKMAALGIVTGADLRGWSLEGLRRHFGSSAKWYHGISRGIDHRPVQPDGIRKSSGSETTFGSDLTDSTEIAAGVARMADDVWNWCERTGQFGRTVVLKIKYADFRQITRSRSPGQPVDTRDLLHDTAQALLAPLAPPKLGIRLVGVTVANFVASAVDPLPLFGRQEPCPTEPCPTGTDGGMQAECRSPAP